MIRNTSVCDWFLWFGTNGTIYPAAWGRFVCLVPCFFFSLPWIMGQCDNMWSCFHRSVCDLFNRKYNMFFLQPLWIASLLYYLNRAKTRRTFRPYNISQCRTATRYPVSRTPIFYSGFVISGLLLLFFLPPRINPQLVQSVWHVLSGTGILGDVGNHRGRSKQDTIYESCTLHQIVSSSFSPTAQRMRC